MVGACACGGGTVFGFFLQPASTSKPDIASTPVHLRSGITLHRKSNRGSCTTPRDPFLRLRVGTGHTGKSLLKYGSGLAADVALKFTMLRFLARCLAAR